jgi:hypothetical protein
MRCGSGWVRGDHGPVHEREKPLAGAAKAPSSGRERLKWPFHVVRSRAYVLLIATLALPSAMRPRKGGAASR